MKYVAVAGGLGNQMFQYAYYLLLKDAYKDVSLFLPSTEWEHESGFELSRVFDIQHTSCLWERLYHKSRIFRKLFSLTHKTYFGKNFKVVASDFYSLDKYSYFYGTWQSEKYMTNPNTIRKSFQFNIQSLSKKTLNIANSMGGKITVAIHIRRGDYLSLAFASGFGNCCPIEYYRRAIEYMSGKLHNPVFIVFSDDMDWVKENIVLDNAIYVDHNKGLDSWQDMYLMSQCEHNIIANSTFSWWGAWLNNNENKIVIAPKRWWSTIEHDDVVPDSWIRI